MNIGERSAFKCRKKTKWVYYSVLNAKLNIFVVQSIVKLRMLIIQPSGCKTFLSSLEKRSFSFLLHHHLGTETA